MGASASKIKFRESLTALTTRDVSPSDTEFWDELWKIPSSSEEVFELLTPSNARLLRDEKFDNLATLFTQATAQLCQIVETPYTIYFDQALNCVRVLTRVVPFLLEKGDLGTNDPNVELLCWGERVDDLEAVLSPKAAAAAGGEGEGASSNGSGNGNGALLSPKSAVESVAEDSSLLSPSECDESSMMLSPKSAMSEQLEDDRGMTTVMNNSRDDGELEVEIKLASPPGRKNNKASTRKNKKGVGDDDYDVNKSKNKEEKKMKRRNLKVDVDASESEESEESATEDEAESDQEEEGDDDEEEAEDEDNEPLALLAVHAAMHMLFLPQFTCEFYEEDGNNYDDMLDSDSEFDDEEMDDDHSEGTDASEAEKRLLEDREGQAEAGLGKPRKIGKGIRLAPRPAGIVWAPGVGFTTDGKCHVGMNPLAEMERRTKKEGGKKSLLSASNSNGPVRLNPEAAYTRKYDKNRIEVLRLLLAACSDPLFAPADEYNPLASRWMAVATAADAPNAPCLFYSLLNTVISYDPKQSIVISGGLGNNETHAKLVELSAQVLCVLLDCGLSGDPIPFENRHGEPVVALNEAYKMGFNIFRVLLARINNGKDLDTLYRGFVRLLRNMFESQSSFGLPTSHGTRLECHQELLILLWKTLEENPLFLDFILTRCDVCELVVPICYLMYVSRKEDAQVGLIHICTFILLKLSGERSFGVSLNRPFRTKLPCDLPLFSGSHADLVSITLHKIIVNGSYRLVPLYSCFLTIVCNFSPYWRSMSLVASVKLVNLFELFSSPKFLYSSEKAYKHLALLLEVFNNIIQYQYNGNQHLVYAIVRRKDSFGRLASLTLPKAIYQCNKAFPVTERPEYDADAEDRATQVAAMSIQDVDEKGKPMKMERINEEESGDSSANKEGGNKEAIKKLAKKKLPGRFVPTESWMAELKSQLPLETVNRLLQHLVPVVDEMCQRKNGVVDEIEILEVFKDITMVGLLPVPHAIVIRKYQPNQYTSIWFTAYMWGVIFLRSQKPPIFDKECIELFQVSNEEEADGKK